MNERNSECAATYKYLLFPSFPVVLLSFSTPCKTLAKFVPGYGTVMEIMFCVTDFG
jgi:hypothetical protein